MLYDYWILVGTSSRAVIYYMMQLDAKEHSNFKTSITKPNGYVPWRRCIDKDDVPLPYAGVTNVRSETVFVVPTLYLKEMYFPLKIWTLNLDYTQTNPWVTTHDVTVNEEKYWFLPWITRHLDNWTIIMFILWNTNFNTER